MDSRLLDALRDAPSLDLYQLRLALDRLLADPRRILDVRRHLHLGAPVMYFDDRRGTLAPGRVLELRPNYATVQDDATRAHWKLPYPAIAVDPALRSATAQPSPPPQVDRSAFEIGDTVSFTDKHLRERVGTITRMNTKTFSLLCDGEHWRVSPSLLRKVIDL
jgi:hypothetical protein